MAVSFRPIFDSDVLFVLKADKYEQILAHRVNGISQNLHIAIDRHNKLVNDDVNAALIEHARSVIMYERQRLRELEALRGDIANADKKYVPVTTPAPRPAYIPKLDEDTRPKPPPVPKPQVVGPALGPSSASAVPSPSARTYQPPLTPSTGGVTLPSKLMSSSSLPPQSPGAGPSTPSPSASSFGRRDSIPPRPTSAAASFNSSGGPPLGGRLIDGKKSMFISHSSAMTASSPVPATPRPGLPSGASQSPLSSVPQPPTPSVARDPLGPLGPNAQYARVPSSASMSASVHSPLGRASFTANDPLGGAPTSPNGFAASNGHAASHPASPTSVDPLSGGQAKYMSQSMRLPNTPARPRLDPREAASKLANMF